MARRFRYYEKKRGHRRTGSRTVGSAGELLFFALFFLIGCGALAATIVFLVVPEWRVNHEFVKAQCVVLDKRLGETDGGPEIHIKYRAEGKDYVIWTYDIHGAYSGGLAGKQAILDQFVVDKENPKTYDCWYDPLDPQNAVLVRGYQWWVWLAFLLPISFLAIGGGGMIYRVLHWGKSAERRAVMAQRTQGRNLLSANGAQRTEFPNIPDDSNITNSPGTRLRYRLPIGTSPGWALFGILLVCVFWNAVVSVFVVMAVRGHLRGEPDWFLTLFTIPFVLGGIALIFLFFRQLLITTGVGATRVEISAHPLHPGQQCRLLVSQSGRLRVNSLDVLLVCQEEATYRQGTNTRTETREVHSQNVFRQEGFEVRPGVPFESECELIVPAEAMHSFKADHNEIQWRVVVKGDVAGWPDYRRSFPVIVHPGQGNQDR